MSERPKRKPPKPSEPVAEASEDAPEVEENSPASSPTPDEIVQLAESDPPVSMRVDVGMISLEVPTAWRVFPLADRVVARPDSNVGVLVVKLLPPDSVPERASHEMFMGVARQASGHELEGTGLDPARERIGCCYAGGETFKTERDFVRIWYSNRPESLVVAWFACPIRRIAERSVSKLIGQCDKIIASIRVPTPPGSDA